MAAPRPRSRRPAAFDESVDAFLTAHAMPFDAADDFMRAANALSVQDMLRDPNRVASNLATMDKSTEAMRLALREVFRNERIPDAELLSWDKALAAKVASCEMMLSLLAVPADNILVETRKMEFVMGIHRRIHMLVDHQRQLDVWLDRRNLLQ